MRKDDGGWARARIAELEQQLAQVRAHGCTAGHPDGSRHIFDHSPISHWQQDMSALAALLESLRAQGVRNPGAHFRRNPEALAAVAQGITITDANHAVADLFGLPTREAMLGPLSRLSGMADTRTLLVGILALWEGRRSFHLRGDGVSAQGKAFRYRMRVHVPDTGRGPDHSRTIVALEDVTAQRRAHKAQAESDARLHGIVDNLPLGVALVDARRQVIFANPRMRAWFPRMTRAGGAVCCECRSDQRDGKCPDCPLRLAAITGKARAREIEVDCMGAVKQFRVTVSPFAAQDGETVAVAVFEDVSERKAAERELICARDAAEAATRAKTRFLANMSHELRTPMNAILGLTELCLSDLREKETRGNLELIQESGRHLLQVLDEILDFSRIEAGKLAINPRPFNLRQTLDGLYRLFKGVAQGKGLGLELRVDPAVGENVWGDPLRLRQVLINLLGNALKVTERGGVTLGARPGGMPGTLQFFVRDTGQGIARDQQRLIFQEFTQLDGSYARSHQGTGLGLSLSRKLVELMQGTIWVESEPGEGSTFHVQMPLDCPQAALPQSLFRPAELDLPTMRVLLVEDNRINLMVARKLLERRGHAVGTAGNGRLALEALAAGDYDMVLMDIQMPEMDGISAARAIRSGSWGARDPDVPIVALTAHVFLEEREAFMRASFDAHVTKPFTWASLSQAMALALDKRGRPAEASCPVAGA